MSREKQSWVRGSCIGRGAYGTVNLGLSLPNGAVFAVKSVDIHSCFPSQLHALENEIKILKSISSPFIVQYLGDDTTSSHRNLHMEYLPRGTAAESAPSSSESLVRRYTWCLVSALSYLHSRGIAHCDVKGKNVLLGGESAKLADFGSAVEFGSGSKSSPVTRGSPLWMAPEVIRGEYQGPESDVWSLGCTVIEMVTGKPAWGVDVDSIRLIGYSNEPPLYPARLSSSGRDFLDKCFSRDYRKRWSCDQLLQHPFVSVCKDLDLITYSSPRCVLDGCDHLEFDDEKVDGEEEEEESVKLGAMERIRELVCGVGANWESSDGWVEVRGGDGVEEEEEVETSLEYFELVGVDEEIHVSNVVGLSSTASSNDVSWDEQHYTRIDVVTTPHIHCNVIQFQEMKRYFNIIVFVLFYHRKKYLALKNYKLPYKVDTNYLGNRKRKCILRAAL